GPDEGTVSISEKHQSTSSRRRCESARQYRRSVSDRSDPASHRRSEYRSRAGSGRGSSKTKPVSVRVRFAPSPTGYLHVGGARTALFDWLFARKHNGTFILRIEDTDTERSSDEMTRGILDAMTWLGLNWDEGPHMQSAGFQRHRDAVMKLLASGVAYHCFCSPELLDQKRKEAAARKTDFKYDRTCFSLPPDEVKQRLDRGERAAVRFKVPDGPVSFNDSVVGEVTISSDMIEDFVLLR